VRHPRYVAEFNPRAGARLAADLFAAGENLALFPMRGRPIQYRNARELAAVWPYVIVYRLTVRRLKFSEFGTVLKIARDNG